MGYTLEQLDADTKQALVDVLLKKKQGEIDMDWSEIKDSFDLDVSADHLRRVGVGVQLASDAGMLTGFNQPCVNTSVMDANAVERAKMFTLRSQLNTVYRNEARSELLRETVEKAVSALQPLPAYEAPVRVSAEHMPGRALVLAIGDFHYGAEINEYGLYGETLNVYNDRVFEDRMRDLLEQTVAILEKERLNEVHVFLVGDLLDGMLRQSQLMRLQYGLVESTIRLSEYLAGWLNELSRYCEEVHVAACTGNHSEIRPLKAKHREFEDENLEKIIIWYLAARLADNPHVGIDEECSRLHMVQVAGYDFLLMHGDDARGISEVARDAVNLYSRKIDFFVCGHLHKDESIGMGATPDGKSMVIRVPSLCGMDSYARSKGLGGRAGATAMVMEERYGRRCVYPIRL